MFTAALLMVAKTQKQRQCPLIDDQIKKMWCISTRKDEIRQDETLPFVTTRTDFENILSE